MRLNASNFFLVMIALAPSAPSFACSSPIPATPALPNPTDNPYLQVGVDAIASGLRTVTVTMTLDTDTDPDLARRINQVHFGMSLTGWGFAAQEIVKSQGNTVILLLTYQR